MLWVKVLIKQHQLYLNQQQVTSMLKLMVQISLKFNLTVSLKI
ncbi:hypothetical protein COI_0181 [Mannheimia haemolytica serotype A2 str. OVINE]|nr:hypothetical protein COI_0181 [Mannheimia haemolytica serotype A2 str. OVINE]EEY11553.1 hypothetical protein COK_2387 [Mannheimia haemolytica serotype A2 str. BOVINE]